MAEFKSLKSCLLDLPLPSEKVIDDESYCSKNCVKPQHVGSLERVVHSRLHAQNESCNARIRYLNLLQHGFGHGMACRRDVFHAVEKLVALPIKLQEP